MCYQFASIQAIYSPIEINELFLVFVKQFKFLETKGSKSDLNKNGKRVTMLSVQLKKKTYPINSKVTNATFSIIKGK